MTDRGRQVYALLRTLDDWVPTPAARPLASTPGFAKIRYETCPDCLANDHPQGMVGCETCGGRGEKRVDGPDPYRNKAAGFYAVELDRRDEWARRDHMIDQLADDAAVRDGRIAPSDALTRALSSYDRHVRAGSYAELQRALQRLRDTNEAAYHVCRLAIGTPLIEPVHRAVIAACELLAEWMPERIRVPIGVHVYTNGELEARAAILRERAQWRGRTDPLARARRDDAIRSFRRQGLEPAAIAERIGVHRRTVERVLNRTADHPSDTAAEA